MPLGRGRGSGSRGRPKGARKARGETWHSVIPPGRPICGRSATRNGCRARRSCLGANVALDDLSTMSLTRACMRRSSRDRRQVEAFVAKLRQLDSHSAACSLADAGEHGASMRTCSMTIFALFCRSTNQRSRMTHTGQKGCIQERTAHGERSGRSRRSQNRDSGSKQQREQGCGECRRERRRHEIYCSLYCTVRTVETVRARSPANQALYCYT
jgi:hypothetical protein